MTAEGAEKCWECINVEGVWDALYLKGMRALRASSSTSKYVMVEAGVMYSDSRTLVLVLIVSN